MFEIQCRLTMFRRLRMLYFLAFSRVQFLSDYHEIYTKFKSNVSGRFQCQSAIFENNTLLKT